MARGIDRTSIVAAALAVLDDGGIDAVTVRAVASRLGVRAPALYHHLHSKQEILDEMGTQIQRQVVMALSGPRPAGDWLDDLSAYAAALRTEYLAHRDGARTFSGTLLTDSDVVKAQEPWLRRWTDAGVSAEAAFDGTELVTAFVVGFVIEEQERAQSVAEPSRYRTRERDRRLGADAPLVVAAGHARHDDEARFRRQLGIVVSGLRAASGH